MAVTGSIVELLANYLDSFGEGRWRAAIREPGAGVGEVRWLAGPEQRRERREQYSGVLRDHDLGTKTAFVFGSV